MTGNDSKNSNSSSSSDNTQELEEILRDLASDAGTARDNLHTGRVGGQYERFMNEETKAVNEAKQRLSRLLIDAKKQENKQWQKLVLDRQELHSSTPYINVLEYEQRIEELTLEQQLADIKEANPNGTE